VRAGSSSNDYGRDRLPLKPDTLWSSELLESIMAGPLKGIKIVDLTTVISGPSATMLLADQGADVIKVESITAPDHARGAGYGSQTFTTVFLNNNRNKQALALDLKKPEGRQALLAVAKDADVVIQNFRPGVVERLGVAYDDVVAVNPEVIYVSISGFGETGPLSHKPVYDPIIQAVSGLATIQGGSDELRPRLVRTILPDKLTGLVTAQAISSALVHKARSAEGQHVRVSMLDAVVNFLWSSDMGSQTFVDHEVSQQRAATFIDLIYETQTRYISVSAMANKQWLGLCDAVGHPEWKADERFTTPALRDRNADVRLQMTQDALLTDTAEHWLERLEAAGVPCAPVLTRNEMIQHPQVSENQLLFEIEHPVAGKIRQARPAARFSRSSPEQRMPAPRHGEHTRALLKASGLSDSQIESLIEQGIAYDGARDLSSLQDQS
jgi:crotonobetainyl-CoA:carnitine CoA-transferase CaiB-like acyl-CoA transferase